MKNTNRKTRKMLRLKIVEHFGTQSQLAYKSKIDEGILSKMVNCVRDPNPEQAKLLSNLLKTPEKKLFTKSAA